MARFEWTFADLGERTRISQRVTADGDGAEALAATMQQMFEGNLPAGMQKLCETIVKSASEVPD